MLADLSTGGQPEHDREHAEQSGEERQHNRRDSQPVQLPLHRRELGGLADQAGDLPWRGQIPGDAGQVVVGARGIGQPDPFLYSSCVSLPSVNQT